MKKEEIEIELVQPEFASVKEFKGLYRFNKGGKRFYFDLINDEIKLFPSVTSLIDKVCPFPKNVVIELVDREGGSKEYYKFMRTKAAYGTIMHICINKYLTSGKDYETRSLTQATIENVIEEICDKSRVAPHKYKYWADEIKADVRCLIMFLVEHRFEPVLIEGTGYFANENYWFAGAMDLIGYMDIVVKGFFGEVYKSGVNKDMPKESKKTERVLALVDWKSGKKGFFPAHAIQLKMYSMIAQEIGLNIQRMFNVAPNETSTSFKLKDQTDCVTDREIEAILELFFSTYNEPEEITYLPEVLTATTEYIKVNIKDHLLNRMKAKQSLKLVA